MAKAFPEATLTIEGQTYRLLLDINAQVGLEERLSSADKTVTFQDTAKAAINGSATAARWLFWASLQRHHPDVTVEQAGTLMSLADGPEKSLGQALDETSPDPVDTKELGIKKRRPRKAHPA